MTFTLEIFLAFAAVVIASFWLGFATAEHQNRVAMKEIDAKLSRLTTEINAVDEGYPSGSPSSAKGSGE